jgi:PAS domain S-box-containing protein
VQERTLSSADEFALLVDAVQDYAIFLLSPDGHIRTWNLGASRIMGYDQSEVVGKHFSLFYGADDLAARKPQVELEVAEREGRVEDEGWRIRKDGRRFWANTIITALRDEHGTLLAFGKVTRDMTRRREAEQMLQSSREIFQLLVSSVRDYAIFMLDPEGRVATWNTGAERIKQYKPSEIIGRHFSTFYPEEDVRNGKPAWELDVARKEGSVEDEGWRVRKDGTRFWANVVITALYDDQGTLRGFGKVTRDITDRKIAEETQQALMEQREARLKAEEERSRAEASYRVAQEANRAKDEFLMTLSHELRTPMTAIVGWSRMLPSISPEDPLFREAINSIAGGAQLQSRIIDDLLDVSRIVSGKMRLAPETIEVGRVIMNAVDAVAQTAQAKQISIESSLSPGLGMMIADPTRVQQVLWNLLANAVKFTPKGGTVQVAARRSSSQVQISVQDSGEGIDPQFLPHIFEPFRQAESPQTRVHGGLGLGLSIVRYIVEAHGGTVAAESDGRGKGATFTVTFPIRAVQDAPVRLPSSDAFPAKDRLRGVSVVLVDDDAESRKLVTAVLRAAGASVMVFDGGAEALESIDERQPDIIVTDIAMPGMDGYTFVRALRDRPYGPSLKIVAFSAFPARLDDTSGFDAYLTKPLDPFEMVEDIARVAERATA